MNNPSEITNPKKVEIPLTQGFVAVVDAEDYASVAELKWDAQKDKRDVVFAVHRFRDSSGKWKKVSMHRFLMVASVGRRIYHLDGNLLNNSRRSNLRVSPPRRATVPRKISGRRFRGISMTPWGTYRAMLHKTYVGSGKTPEDAALLYDQAAYAKWGDAAVLNFPDLVRASA